MNSETVPVIKDKDDFFEICWGSHPDWKLIQKDESFVKHDITNYDHLVKYKETGKYYSLWYDRSYNYGVELDMNFPWSPPEVEVTEVTKYTWKEKAKSSPVKTYIPE